MVWPIIWGDVWFSVASSYGRRSDPSTNGGSDGVAPNSKVSPKAQIGRNWHHHRGLNQGNPEKGMEARVGIEPTNRGFADPPFSARTSFDTTLISEHVRYCPLFVRSEHSGPLFLVYSCGSPNWSADML